MVANQLHVLRGCLPLHIPRALEEVPATLDWTYERALQDIPDIMWESAHVLLQCVLVSSRPLLVEELAEFLALNFKSGLLPEFQASCRPEDPEDTLLSACPGLLAIVEEGTSRIVQFSHSSVKEFLISDRLAMAIERSSRYHVDITRAHTMVAEACLSVLLSMDGEVSNDNLRNFPLATYATNHWFHHLKFNNASQHIQEGVKSLLDPSRPHFPLWISMHDSNGCLPPQPHPKSSSQTERTPLHYAATYNLPDMTDFLASVPWQDINAVGNPHKETPLMVASEMGHVEIVRVLLARGANANARDHNMWTPLHWASQERRLEVVQLLLEHGVDANARDQNKQTPLYLALEGRLEVARLLLERGADANALDHSGQTALHIASREGHLENAQLLLEQRADANSRDRSKRTPLYFASQEGRVEIAQLLLEHGADAKTMDDNFQTPLHMASREGHLEIAQLLFECGAYANSQDKSRQTPLHMVSQEGHLEVAQLLLEKGANPNARDRGNQTPLHIASQEGHLEVAQLLLERGADINARGGRNHQIPLHLASQAGHLEVAQLLLDRGTIVNAQDKNGQTPLHVASHAGRLEVAQLLLDRGASVGVRDYKFQTPTYLASNGSHVEVAQLLRERGGSVYAWSH